MPRVAICAPSRAITEEDAARVQALATAIPGVDLHFHPQCFMNDGHFAGPDATRVAALVECANDPSFDAVWFARGGYGAARVAQDALAKFTKVAETKAYLGYSDGGILLGALYRGRVGQPVHAPMCADIRRPGGEEAVRRVLGYLNGESDGIEGSSDPHPRVAFNLMTLAMLCGTPLMPGLSGHVVMVEEVSEYHYSIDRLLFHITAHLGGVAGFRLGRVSDVPENDVAFGHEDEDMARYWCARHAIPYLGRADIGHDVANKIVPFGLAAAVAGQ